MEYFKQVLDCLSCSDFYKYVINDCVCHSKCCEWFDCEIETHKVEAEEVETPKQEKHSEFDFMNIVHIKSDSIKND